MGDDNLKGGIEITVRYRGAYLNFTQDLDKIWWTFAPDKSSAIFDTPAGQVRLEIDKLSGAVAPVLDGEGMERI